jgi:hypothetical protein
MIMFIRFSLFVFLLSFVIRAVVVMGATEIPVLVVSFCFGFAFSPTLSGQADWFYGRLLGLRKEQEKS